MAAIKGSEPMTYREQVLAILDGTYYQKIDLVDRYRLMMKAVEVLKAEPDIEYYPFASKVGLTERNGQLGMTGWYIQVAKEIIERQEGTPS